jgi:hypothetical protein
VAVIVVIKNQLKKPFEASTGMKPTLVYFVTMDTILAMLANGTKQNSPRPILIFGVNTVDNIGFLPLTSKEGRYTLPKKRTVSRGMLSCNRQFHASMWRLHAYNE